MHAISLPIAEHRPATLPTGCFRAHKQDAYRTQDGRAVFEFQFVSRGNHYEIDILSQPDYGGRESDLHNTHRLPSDRGGYRICFGDPQVVANLPSAYKWAAMWAEHTWKYIHHGTPFPNQGEVVATGQRLWRRVADWPVWTWLGYVLGWAFWMGVLTMAIEFFF